MNPERLKLFGLGWDLVVQLKEPLAVGAHALRVVIETISQVAAPIVAEDFRRRRAASLRSLEADAALKEASVASAQAKAMKRGARANVAVSEAAKQQLALIENAIAVAQTLSGIEAQLAGPVGSNEGSSSTENSQADVVAKAHLRLKEAIRELQWYGGAVLPAPTSEVEDGVSRTSARAASPSSAQRKKKVRGGTKAPDQAPRKAQPYAGEQSAGPYTRKSQSSDRKLP